VRRGCFLCALSTLAALALPFLLPRSHFPSLPWWLGFVLFFLLVGPWCLWAAIGLCKAGGTAAPSRQTRSTGQAPELLAYLEEDFLGDEYTGPIGDNDSVW
jgi:4-amino-4-deoxy-L-arabinose transferase-like glycosyltransferase